tara:strand:+ start:744 stop:959 length:216 start_codon:yes stop_codon:yes gene_type:complete
MIPLFDRRNFSIPLVMLLVCVALCIATQDYFEAIAWGCASLWCLLANRLENQYAKDIATATLEWTGRSKRN